MYDEIQFTCSPEFYGVFTFHRSVEFDKPKISRKYLKLRTFIRNNVYCIYANKLIL